METVARPLSSERAGEILYVSQACAERFRELGQTRVEKWCKEATPALPSMIFSFPLLN